MVRIPTYRWVTGGMIATVFRLRDRDVHNPSIATRVANSEGVHDRVQVSNGPIQNPAYRLSYLVQGLWPDRAASWLADTTTALQSSVLVREPPARLYAI